MVQRLERAILVLDQHPERCPVAPESFDPDSPVRVCSATDAGHACIESFPLSITAPKVVRMVHVRGGARQQPTVDELKDE